jgi:hypothetical protein
VPSTQTSHAKPSPVAGARAAVRRAIGSVEPIVTMWRDGLTIIALESREPNREPDYLTFEQAQLPMASRSRRRRCRPSRPSTR